MLHWGPGAIYRNLHLSIELLLLLFVSTATAQQFTFSAEGMESGLSNLNVRSMLEDRTGVVWVGTELGVFVANGPRFEKQKAFSDAGLEIILALSEDSAGRIWALDSTHLVYLQDGVVRGIHGLNLSISSMEPPDLLALPGDPDAMYLVRHGELLRVASMDHGHSWKISSPLAPSLVGQHPELRSVTSLASGGGFIVWAGCAKKLCEVDLRTGRARTFGEEQGVRPDHWKRLLVTRSGSTWARGERHVVNIPAGGNHFQQVGNFPAGSYLNVQSPALCEDKAGDILLNLDKGIARIDGHGWRIYKQRNGLVVDEIATLMVDRSGQLWLAPVGHGFLLWRGYGNWENWTEADGLSGDLVWSIAGDRAGRIWVAGETNLDRLDPLKGRITPQGHPFSFRRLSAVVVDGRQHVWTGNSMGDVLDIDPKTGRARSAGSGLGAIFQMLVDREERIWVCSGTGLHFFSPADRWSKLHEIKSAEISESHPWSMAESTTGILWVTTRTGLFRLVGETWTTFRLPFLARPDFLLATAPDGTLWVQSKLPFPLLHLKVTGDTVSVMDRVDGTMLVSDNIVFMAVDHRGWLWVGSDDGVQVFNGERWVQCTTEDGLLWDDTDSRAFFADSDGSAWIGTSAGLAHVLHPEQLFTVPPPRLQIKDARLADYQLGLAGNPKFDLRKPTLNIHLIGTNYWRGSAVVYVYKLEGQENQWQQSDWPVLRFPALEAGSYTLRVFADDRRTHQKSSIQSISFTVLEPWWKRGWFRLLEALVILLLFFGTWRFSVRLLVARQQELQSVVAQRTRELEEEKVELLRARSALIEMTRRDTLTGLLNRAAIFERMSALCEVAIASGNYLAIVMADLDSFKRINDEYGHVVGDTVIRECALRISQTIRPGDAVGRYGGEELLILIPGLHPESAADRLEELRLAISEKLICHGDIEVQMTCSFGVAWFGGKRCALETLVSMADGALYLAKRNGRNRVEFAHFGSMATGEIVEARLE